MPRKKFRIWLADDREVNRKTFKSEQSANFDVSVFETPNDVLAALRSCPRPDAMLCDIYFYKDPQKREEIETRVASLQDELKRIASEFGAREAQAGIDLIATIRANFGGEPPFPIYAYTSKGPYLLQSDAFDRLEELDARWLFKGKYSPQAITHQLVRDLFEFRSRFWRRRVWGIVAATGLISAFLGALLSVVFDRLAHRWFCF